jgi:predicted nucleic acid-binding protein
VFVFIDTNILLSFYHFASDDLDELLKLLDSIKKGAIVLVLPEQVVQEFWRNREAKIADALSRLRDQKLNLQFPQICKDSALYSAMRTAQKDYERIHGQLVAELTRAASQRQLKADKVIEELFRYASRFPLQDALIARAQLRINLGNPPGKNGSLGDAVNWETLLEHVPNEKDLYFVSDDKDFRSAIDDTQFSQFLAGEWRQKKSSDLRYYSRLSGFFADYYPNIKLATEKEIERLIGELATSGSFAFTHAVIAKFNQYTDFTNDQANQIVAAIISNNQVYWIIRDEDVSRFARRVIQDKEKVINEANLSYLREMLPEPPEPESSGFDEEIPF